MKAAAFSGEPEGVTVPELRVLMLDPLTTVPYYTAYLSRALLAENVDLRIAAIDYYLDPECFSSRGLPLQPGLLNLVGRFPLPPLPRRGLKLLELGVNLSALSVRALFRAPEVLHIQFLPLLRWPLPFDLWFAELCQRRGSRLVLTVHDLLPHDTDERYKSLFQKLYGRMNALICHSGHIRSRLQAEFSVPAEKIAVIPHGPFFYDLPVAARSGTRARLGIGDDRLIVLWQGIIFPYKGLDLLLTAWKRVETASPQAHLVVVGTGAPELLVELREQVARLSLERVTLDLRFASTEELVETYRAAEVVVYPYRAITTSGALATGLSLGKAIVASDLPVFRELLTDGVNALLTPPGDAEGLGDAIIRLLGSPALREQMERKVGGMNFGAGSWQSIAADTIEVYRAVVAAGRGAAAQELRSTP